MDEKRNDVDDKCQDDAITLAQWQTCVEMANSISIRRDSMNNLFVSLNLAILAAVSFIWGTKTIVLLISGIFICIVWFLSVRYYRMVNNAKYEVILDIEKVLPFQPFDKEWCICTNKKRFIEGTKLEVTLPILFCITYFVIIIILLDVDKLIL